MNLIHTKKVHTTLTSCAACGGFYFVTGLRKVQGEKNCPQQRRAVKNQTPIYDDSQLVKLCEVREVHQCGEAKLAPVRVEMAINIVPTGWQIEIYFKKINSDCGWMCIRRWSRRIRV